MTTEITYHSQPFPYVIIDDLYSEEELRLIWKDFNHVYPLLLPGDKTGSAKDNGVFQKKNKGIFINHEDNTILRLGGKTWSLLNTLKESLNPGEWWLKNIRTSDSKTLVSYYEDTDYYKAHSDCAEIICLSSVVLIKSLISQLRYLTNFLKFSDILSVNNLGVRLLFLAALSTFCPCSSVPVKKYTSSFFNL